jgi:transposase
VEQWAEIRRMHFVERLAIKEIQRRTGRDRKTIRRALRSNEPPRYRRPPRPSKLDPFRDEIDRLLRSDPRLPGKRVRELIEELGYLGSKTILDDYLRELRPRYLPGAPTSGPTTAPASCCSSTSSSRASRSRSATASCAGAGW